MADNVAEYTDSNFQAEVLDSDKLTVVDFWAEWCAPCRMIGPVIEELAGEYGDTVGIGKVNVDENNKVATQFSVRSIPTILFIKGGEVIQQVVGVRSKAELKEIIDANI